MHHQILELIVAGLLLNYEPELRAALGLNSARRENVMLVLKYRMAVKRSSTKHSRVSM